MTHLTEEDLICLYYAEPGAPADARTHLAACPECRAAAQALGQTLNLCSEWTVPERAPEFGRDVWLRLVPELDAVPEKRGWQWLFTSHPARAWVASTALALLLIAVFVAGRLSRPAAPPLMAGLSDQARERILAIAVADHLERVQVLLTEISNSSDASLKNFAADRLLAEDLVQEGRLMRQTLAARGDTATTGFLDEVERFLIEAEHTPDSATAGEVLGLREQLESASLLFKVRVVESNLRSTLI